MFSPDNNIIDFAAFTSAPDVLPTNIEIEIALLGGLLLDGNAIDAIAEIIPTPAVFYINSHACLYRCMLALHDTGKPIDLLTATNWLTDQKLLDKVGGKAFLVRLLDVTVHSFNLDTLARTLVEKWTRRELIAASSKIEKIAHDGTKTIEQVKDEVEQTIYDITQSHKSDLDAVETISDICPRLWQQIEQGRSNAIKTGFYDLDAATGGYYPATLTVAAGRTSMGKSQLAIAQTYEVARLRLPVVFFTCEMSKEEIANRLLARVAMVDSALLREGKILQSEWEHLAKAYSTLDALPIHIYSAPSPSAAQMRSVLRQVKSKHKVLGLVVLDYIQLLGGGGESRVSELDKIVREFRALAKEFDVPALALAQINRAVESRSDKRPLMSDIRESGAIEAHADVVLLLYREGYYNPSSPDRNIIEISVAKNRHGETGVVRMLFSPAYSLFRNLAKN